MMMRAQRQQIIQLGLTAIAPMHDVVRIDPLLVRAPRKATTSVARGECTAYARRHCALLAPNVQRLALGVLDHRHHGAIAAQPAHRL